MNKETTPEFLCVLNENGTVSPKTVSRNEAHREGILHGASHIYLYALDHGALYFLLQRRSPNKDSYPNCLDTSAAGHMEAGMDFLSTAYKELEEELGIKKESCTLRKAFVHRCDKTETFHGKLFRNREMFTVYFAKIPLNIPLKPQKEEISETIWMKDSELSQRLRTADNEFCMDPAVFFKVRDMILKQESQ